VAADADCTPGQGALFAGRYRLQDPLNEPGDSAARERHWRGFDEVLARPVLVTVLPAGGADADDLLASAVANGRVAHPGIASVFDAANVDGCTYVVSEWVEGTALTKLLRDGPMPPAQAAAVVHAAADAVATMHAQGLAHGNLHPDNVLLTSDGGVKLTALRTNSGGAEAADVRRLGALLYTALTGRWPSHTAGSQVEGISDAPYDDGRLCSPRQVRAGVSGSLSRAAMRALAPEESALTAARLAEDVSRHAEEADTGRLPTIDEPEPDLPPRRSRWRRVALLVSALLVISAAGLLVGFRLGAIPAPSGTYLPFDPRGAKPAAPAVNAPRSPLKVTDARILDPQGDGTELRGAGRTFDGDAGTVWRTDDYRTAKFGNLKAGMGVLLDLGSPRTVHQVSVVLAEPGGAYDVRTSDTNSDSPGAYRTVATQRPRSSTTTSTLGSPATARYWLVWVTELAPHNGQYAIGVAEVRLS